MSRLSSFWAKPLCQRVVTSMQMTSFLIHKSNNRPDNMLPSRDGLMSVLNKKTLHFKTFFPASASVIVLHLSQQCWRNDTQLLKTTCALWITYNICVCVPFWKRADFSYLLLLKVAVFDGWTSTRHRTARAELIRLKLGSGADRRILRRGGRSEPACVSQTCRRASFPSPLRSARQPVQLHKQARHSCTESAVTPPK